MRRVDKPRVDRRGKVRFLDQAEESRLRNALMERDFEMQNRRTCGNNRRQTRHEPVLPPLTHFGDHLTPAVLLSMNTGLRRGEVVKLRWGSVDFNRRLLTVEGRNAKNRQTRHVPLNDEAVSVLRRWREQSGTGARVFDVATGFQTAWEKVLKRARITNFRNWSAFTLPSILSFNPNLDSTGAPRRMDIKTDGSRFNPFPSVTGANVLTLYAGTTDHAAALESVFHDVPHIPNPQFPTSKLTDFVLSRFTIKRPLLVLELINSQLRHVPVPGHDESLMESEIVHSSPAQYPTTRQWAQYVYNNLPTLQGLAWRPRLGGEGAAYVFFGDRISPTSDLQPDTPAIPIDTGPGRVLIEQIASTAHITLVHTKL